MNQKNAPEPKNHLTHIFYTQPHIARATMTTQAFRETMLYHSDGRILACGYMWDIVGKSAGAGVYIVTLKKAFSRPAGPVTKK